MIKFHREISLQNKFIMENQETVESVTESSLFDEIYSEIVNSPLNIFLIGVIAFLIYKIFTSSQSPSKSSPIAKEPELPKLRKDFTAADMKAYDGNQPDGRVLVAVNGNVFDVTRGKKFYGPVSCR